MGVFTMPSLGADMERGTLLEWRVAPGDRVERGDIIAVVDTEKSAVEVEVFESGVVTELLVEPGTEVEVGAPLASIGPAEAAAPAAGGEPPAAPAPPPPTAAPPTAPPPRTPPPPVSPAPVRTPAAAAPHHDPVVLSPLVRQLAARRGVDLDRVVGSGVGNRITRADVERAGNRRRPQGPGASPLARRRAAELGVDVDAIRGSGPGGAVRARDLPDAAPPTPTPAPPAPGAPSPAPAPGTDRNASIRRAIARLMERANRDIPHYHLTHVIDLQPALDWLAAANAGRPPAARLLPAALLLRATALAADRHPELNGHWVDDGFRGADRVDLGVAISLRGGGLVTPVLRDASQLTVEDTMDALRQLVTRARQGMLRSSDLGEASLTVTNLGERGADSVLGVIHPPQVALVGFGGVLERPWVVDGAVTVRSVVIASLAGDHRATDGHAGSRLLATLADLLSRPDQL